MKRRFRPNHSRHGRQRRGKPRPYGGSYFLPALTLAHLARCAAAILLRPAGDIDRFLRVARLRPCR